MIQVTQGHLRTNEKGTRDYDKLRSMSSELLLTGERERRRISADFHKRIGNTLALLKIKIGSLKESSTSPKELKTIVDIDFLVDQAILDTRSMIFELSPPILYELGLDEAIEWYVEKIHKEYGILVHLKSDKSPRPLETGLRILVFQAACELLFNVARHASASQAKIMIRNDGDTLCIEVTDDGIGFDPYRIEDQVSPASGVGLFALRECLESLGGSMDIKSRIGMGTRVTLLAPLQAGAESDEP